MAGHITWQPDGQTEMYVNPWGLWWQELTASDICVVDEDARVLARAVGRHARDPHPHRTTPAAARRPGGGPQPPVLRQPDRRPRHAARAGASDRFAVPRRHVPASRSTTARSMHPGGQPNWLSRSGRPTWSSWPTTASSPPARNLEEAVYRAVSIERVCRLAYDVMVTGEDPVEMNRGDMLGMKAVADRTRRRRVLGRRGAR